MFLGGKPFFRRKRRKTRYLDGSGHKGLADFPPVSPWIQAPAATPAHAVSAGANVQGIGVDYSGVAPVGHSMPVADRSSGICMPFLPVTPSTEQFKSLREPRQARKPFFFSQTTLCLGLLF